MDEILAQFIATGLGLVIDHDIFVDESAADTRNCILVKTMATSSGYTGIAVFDASVIICDVVYDTARTRAASIEALFNHQRGISGGSWGTIGNVVSHYEGTDTMKRTVYSVAFKTGKQEV
jgi:hypothetical protein